MIRRLTDAAITTGAVLPPATTALHEVAATEGADTVRFADGYRDGFEAGEADALREAEARLAKLESELWDRHEQVEASLSHERNRWSELAASLAEAERDRLADMEKDAFEIALLALSALLGESGDDGERLSRMVTQVVNDHRSSALLVQVAETDLALLSNQIDGICIEADAGMAPGSCRLLTAHGRFETSIKERLEVIHRTMLGALERAAQ